LAFGYTLDYTKLDVRSTVIVTVYQKKMTDGTL